MRHATPRDADDSPPTPSGLSGFAALRPYLSLLQGQGLLLVAATLLMVVSTAISLLIPIFAGRYVDAMGQTTPDGPSGRSLAILGGLLVLQLLGTFSFAVVSARLGLQTVARLRKRLYAHLLELPALFFSGQKAGDISTRVTSDVGSIQYILTNGIVTLARAVLTLVVAIIIMLGLNARLTMVVLLLIPATIALVRLFGTRLRKLSRSMYDELGRISSHVQESVAGIRTLKVYNNQNHEEARFAAMVDTYQNAGLKRAWLSAALESGIQILLWACLIAVMVYGFMLAGRGETTNGQLVTFLLLVFRVAMPLSSLTSLYASGQGAIAAAGRLDDVFATKPEREPGATVPAPCHGAAGISLAGVGFRYPGSPTAPAVLHNLSVDIDAGQWIGIVGPSGAGKTTLAGLLMGLFPPDHGQLALDGKPYADFDLSELRSRMGFVAQDPVIYDMTLRDNIRFGRTDAPDTAVADAAAKAGVMAFADKLEAGLDTPCGERGARLSGGQRQRVALARAFLRDPGILILDEPTSALDAASEEAIRASLKQLMTGRTAIVIAHRFSLVRDLDRILVLSEGKLVEDGNHQQLMELGGLYRSLYMLQQGSVVR